MPFIIVLILNLFFNLNNKITNHIQSVLEKTGLLFTENEEILQTFKPEARQKIVDRLCTQPSGYSVVHLAGSGFLLLLKF